jgi:hypothetical protein
MDVSEENLFAMKRHNMQSVERGGGKVGYMTELVELRFMSVRIRRSQFFHKSCSAASSGRRISVTLCTGGVTTETCRLRSGDPG